MQGDPSVLVSDCRIVCVQLSIVVVVVVFIVRHQH